VVESAGREFFGGKISSRANCGTSSLTPRRFSRVFGIPSIGEHERRNEQPARTCRVSAVHAALRPANKFDFDLQPGVLLDVLRVKQPRTPRGPDESREPLLSLDRDGEARTATCRAAKLLWRKGPLPVCRLRGWGRESWGMRRKDRSGAEQEWTARRRANRPGRFGAAS